MAENPSARRSASRGREDSHSEKLRTLANWYRGFAERAGSAVIWEARVRTAEDLEAEAERIETGFALRSPAIVGSTAEAPLSVEELRAEARRLIDQANAMPDSAARRQIAARAFALSQRAEAVALAQENPEIIRWNIERYRSMLGDGIDDEPQRRLVEEMLADAEAALAEQQKP